VEGQVAPASGVARAPVRAIASAGSRGRRATSQISSSYARMPGSRLSTSDGLRRKPSSGTPSRPSTRTSPSSRYDATVSRCSAVTSVPISDDGSIPSPIGWRFGPLAQLASSPHDSATARLCSPIWGRDEARSGRSAFRGLLAAGSRRLGGFDRRHDKRGLGQRARSGSATEGQRPKVRLRLLRLGGELRRCGDVPRRSGEYGRVVGDRDRGRLGGWSERAASRERRASTVSIAGRPAHVDLLRLGRELHRGGDVPQQFRQYGGVAAG